MTERCQTKFTEKFDNQNYIIYVGIISASLAVLYFYRFHFIAVVVSYVLGCVACYYALNSSILHKYVQKLKCHVVGSAEEARETDAPVKGCVTCGSKDCARHDPGLPTEPWEGLQIHKQLDQAIEDFYNTILDQFINTWYSKITLQPFFVDELRHQLRYASASLLRRAIKINYSRLIMDRLVPCALHHYCVCAGPEGGTGGAHPALSSRAQELRYLRAVTDAVMPHLLVPAEVGNDVFRVLIREIFAGWVLLSLTDVLADPYILNTLIVLATDGETMAQLPTTPNYNVEFLERFARHTESVYVQRCSLLRLDLEQVVADQDYFYAFMQYLKAASHIHLLQFYKDIKSFQTKLLNPELGVAERASLHKEACDIYELYLSEQSHSRVPLDPSIAQEMHECLLADDSIKRLQTSRALYQAARQSHAILEKIMLPKFLHSEEYYKLVIGSRIPTGYQKQTSKKPQDRLLQSALRLGSRLKGALRPQTIDGQVLDCFTNTDEDEGPENMDLVRFLETLGSEDSRRDQDLSTYKVVLTNVETRAQAPPRRGTVRVFTLAVHRLDGCAGARLWTLERSEHDFHLLRSKMHEFHGDRLLHDLPLPSRRDNSPMETLRYKYEDFLQRLLQKSLLQTSELLHLFLTVDGDFSMVVQASTLNANSTDLANIYQSVTHKLRKEKGQHLENFLKNLLVSSDMDRYQALKQGSARDVEEAQEVSEDPERVSLGRVRATRDIRRGVFGDNLGLYPAPRVPSRTAVAPFGGFTQCLMFVLVKVIKARGFLAAVAGSLVTIARGLLDDAFNMLLNRLLGRLLSERRLAHLIGLGHALLFGKKASSPRADPAQQRELARKQLLRSIPSAAVLVAGSGLPLAAHTAFEIIQRPQLNKQLVYNLLDLCLMELFPELGASEKPSKEPKS